MTKLEKK